MTKVSFRDSVLCATRGLFRGISNERNIKIQLMIGAIITLTAVLLGISKVYLITIIIVCFLVVILEMFNRGFEKLIDLISPEYNKEFGKVKDVMAGVFLLTFIMAIIISALILYEPVINFLGVMSKNPDSLVLIIANIFLCSIILLAYFIKNKD
jgi:diacylglycerol kinase